MKKRIEKTSKIEIIIAIVKFICIIFLLLMIAVVGIQRFSNNKNSIGGYRVFTVATGSMIPTYKIGDTIIIKEVDANSLKVGDPITYEGKSGDLAGRVVTHRIIAIDETENGKVFHTMGDANDIEDPTITGDQIYGKVIYRCIIISLLTRLMTNLTAFYVLVFIPIGIYVFLQIKDIVGNKEDDEDEEQEDDDDDED